MSGLYLDHYLGRNAQKGYNTMAGRKNGVTDSTCKIAGVNPALSSLKDAKSKNLSANPGGLMAENPR